MNRALTLFMLSLFVGLGIAAPILAQARGANPATPSFEVASVKVNKSGSSSSGSGTTPGGRLTVTNETLRQLLRDAYRLQDFQVVGGPDWTSDEHFDIAAKAEGSADDDQIRLMLRSLLAERFHLVVHNETKDMPVYALVRSRGDGKLGPSLRVSDVDCGAPAAQARPCGTHMNSGSNGACRRIRYRSQVDA